MTKLLVIYLLSSIAATSISAAKLHSGCKETNFMMPSSINSQIEVRAVSTAAIGFIILNLHRNHPVAAKSISLIDIGINGINGIHDLSVRCK